MNHKMIRRLPIALLVVFGFVAAASVGVTATAPPDDTDAMTEDTEAMTEETVAMAEETVAMAEGTVPDGPTIRIRGQDFSESVTIAEVYGQYLGARGYDVEMLTAAGFRTEAIEALSNGDVDLIIDYIGGALTALAPDEGTSSDPDEIVSIIGPAYEALGATLLDYSPAVDGDAMVVRGDYDAAIISDLVGLDATIGASAACYERPQCFLGYTDPAIYGIEFADTVTIEFGPLLGEALSAGEVDVVVWNTTAPQIGEQGFVILEDDLGLHPAQNIAPIVATPVLEAYGDHLEADLNELSALITTEDLLEWNVETDINFRESDDVAADWLEAEGLN